MKKLTTVLLLLCFFSNIINGLHSLPVDSPDGDKKVSPGLFNITEINAGFGLGDTDVDYSKSFYGLSSVLGYGISKNVYVGIGAGLSFYDGGMLVPLFLDLRGIISFGKISGYAFGDGGILFNFSESDYEDRILLNPGIGIMFPLSNKLSGNIGTGLLVQTTKDRERHDSFVNLKVGITYTFKKQSR